MHGWPMVMIRRRQGLPTIVEADLTIHPSQAWSGELTLNNWLADLGTRVTTPQIASI